MRNGARRLTLFLLCCAVAGPLAVQAEPMSDREVKKAVKKADKAYEAGNLAEALPLYEQILDSTEPGDDHRAGALYALALEVLAKGGEAEDESLAAAGERLRELRERHPRHRGQEVRAALAWLDERAAIRAEVAELRADLDQHRDATDTQDVRLQELNVQITELTQKLDAAEKELAVTRKGLAAAREDLAKKDEAIKKLRDTLVKAGG